MKKILFLIPCLIGGGAERVMVTLANGFSKTYDVEILTLTHTESFYKLEDAVKVTGIGCSVNKKKCTYKICNKSEIRF